MKSIKISLIALAAITLVATAFTSKRTLGEALTATHFYAVTEAVTTGVATDDLKTDAGGFIPINLSSFNISNCTQTAENRICVVKCTNTSGSGTFVKYVVQGEYTPL